MTKIGRNDLCPCGSGKKYKKCCMEKGIYDTKDVKLNDNAANNYNPFGVEYAKEHHSKYFNQKLNNKLNLLYNNYQNLSSTKIIDEYLEIMNELLNFAKKHKVKTPEELDNFDIIDEFTTNIIGNFELEISNLNLNGEFEYDLNVLINYLDRLLETFTLDQNTYENMICCKCNTLFKLERRDEGEKLMLDYIRKNPKQVYAYVELVDDFKMVHDLDKAKYYYDLGMKIEDTEEKDALEERNDYFKKNL